MAEHPPLDNSAESHAIAHSRTRAVDPVRMVRVAIKNSPWVVIAIMAHIVIIAVMSVMYIRESRKKEETSVTTVGISPKSLESLDPVVQPPEVIDRKAIPKNVDAEVVSYEEDIPFMPTDMEEDLSLPRGDPTALTNLPAGGATGGTSVGVGGAGHYGAGRPSPFASRKVGSGGGRGGGATQSSERAVIDGLIWLIRHQKPDGSWSAKAMHQICKPDAPCVPKDEELAESQDEGLTGLALLAFLGSGFSNESKQNMVDRTHAKRHRLGEVIKNGLLWLKNRQRPDGSFSDQHTFHMYNEALGTLALSEAYGLTGNRIWKDAAQKAVDFLVQAQKPNPNGQGRWGWRYTSRVEIERDKDNKEIYPDETAYTKELHDADTSVTTWVIMALKSAELSGLNVPTEAMGGAMDFIKWVSVNDGMVGYNSPEAAGLEIRGPAYDRFKYHIATMSALGMCSRTFIEKNREDPFLELAAKQLIKDLPVVDKDNKSVDYYYWYYGTLALNQYDGPDAPKRTGKYWNPWNRAMTEALIGLQDRSERTCASGGWLTSDQWGSGVGPIYSTAINVLTLEVYYRFENAFGGVKSVKDKKSAGREEAKKDEATKKEDAAPKSDPEKKG